jgi:AP endonuclease-2
LNVYRPVGPGYDAGKSVRAREDVNPEYRCNFFKWASEVRREAMREGKVVIGASPKRRGRS